MRIDKTRVAVATAFGGPEVVQIVDEALAKPLAGQVLVEVEAIGVNPFDYKSYSGEFGADESALPLRLGSEASGIVRAVGNTARGPAGPISVGDEVIVSGAKGAYAEKLLVPADAVLPKPSSLSWEEAAGLLSVAGTAFDTIEVVGVSAGDTVLVHGAAGSVGSIVVQLAVARGARVIGTARAVNHEALLEYGAEPVEYGSGLLDRVKALAPDGIAAAIDTVGTDEAVDVSLALVSDKARIVTIAAFGRAGKDGFTAVGGGNPESAARRKKARADLVAAAGRGELKVPIAKTFPLAEVAQAHAELNGEHPRGKFVLIP
ncbi:NADP-dependent oxidoreductase [Rhodococcus sp. G-MC3]|uniref:NADP-dependent oxidoreductase n=1 Tax=Rhodococcus sp. G-MC3 TaxID=3046209 RepID=UPI0024B9CD1A|nr:NADP-dependent oxidoreductase [Rhodococcus sp. G-MC3]MDJ0393283.1 NADP-dependent oxidoreductase [Rhodococcus sp. G-MC3]